MALGEFRAKAIAALMFVFVVVRLGVPGVGACPRICTMSLTSPRHAVNYTRLCRRCVDMDGSRTKHSTRARTETDRRNARVPLSSFPVWRKQSREDRERCLYHGPPLFFDACFHLADSCAPIEPHTPNRSEGLTSTLCDSLGTLAIQFRTYRVEPSSSIIICSHVPHPPLSHE